MNQLSMFGNLITIGTNTADHIATAGEMVRKLGSGLRDTSIEAFHDHKASGKLSQQQSEIVDYLLHLAYEESLGYFHDDVTRSELAQALGLRVSAICGRISELLKIGKLIELPRRVCKITGKSAHPVRLA